MVGRPARAGRCMASALLLLLGTAVRADIPPPDARLSEGQVIPFDGFVDQNGQPFRAQRDARPWVVLPIYTRCPTTCSALTAALRGAVRESGLRAEDYRVVSFSFDSHETDATLREFRDRMQLPAEWLTLRAAAPEALERTLRALDFRTLQLDDGRIEHPNLVVVLGGDRSLVAYLSGAPLSPSELARVVRQTRDGEAPLDRWRRAVFVLATLGFAISAALFVGMLGRVTGRGPQPPSDDAASRPVSSSSILR